MLIHGDNKKTTSKALNANCPETYISQCGHRIFRLQLCHRTPLAADSKKYKKKRLAKRDYIKDWYHRSMTCRGTCCYASGKKVVRVRLERPRLRFVKSKSDIMEVWTSRKSKYFLYSHRAHHKASWAMVIRQMKWWHWFLRACNSVWWSRWMSNKLSKSWKTLAFVCIYIYIFFPAETTANKHAYCEYN